MADAQYGEGVRSAAKVSAQSATRPIRAAIVSLGRCVIGKSPSGRGRVRNQIAPIGLASLPVVLETWRTYQPATSEFRRDDLIHRLRSLSSPKHTPDQARQPEQQEEASRRFDRILDVAGRFTKHGRHN
jgi:hypothetical protein